MMSEPEEQQRAARADTQGDIGEANSPESVAAVRAGQGDAELSETGVGLSVGEANTFEPEEAGSVPETETT